MYKEIEEWLNTVLNVDVPDEVIAFNFNLGEDDDNCWYMELVGTESFDFKDEDWACDEITDFGTRENPLTWHQKTTWKKIMKEAVAAIMQYLEKGKYANILKSRKGVGVGFVDGDLEIVYSD